MRLQDRHRTTASTTGRRCAVEAARAKAGHGGEGCVDAARAERRGEVREDEERLGFSGGGVVDEGEAGDQGGSNPTIAMGNLGE